MRSLSSSVRSRRRRFANPVACRLDGAMKSILQQLAWRQVRQVFSNVDATCIQVQVLDRLALLARAKDDPDRSFLGWLPLVAIPPTKIQLHLSGVGRFEVIDLQLDHDKATHAAVEEEQVDVEIVTVEHDALLAFDECEACTQLEQEAFDLAEDGGLEIVLAVCIHK